LHCLAPWAASLPLLPFYESVIQSAFELLGHLHFLDFLRAGLLATLPLLLAFVLELVVAMLRW
jgi:hypothetical protein